VCVCVYVCVCVRACGWGEVGEWMEAGSVARRHGDERSERRNITERKGRYVAT
jgi:hypothetical protein